MQAMLVVDVDLLTRNRLRQRGQSLLIAKAVIRLAFLDQLFGIFQINALLLPVALHIRADASVPVGTLVVQKTRILQSAVNNIHSPLHIALLIRILNTQDKIPAFVLRYQIRIQRRPQIANVHPPCGTGRVSCSYFLAHDYLHF